MVPKLYGRSRTLACLWNGQRCQGLSIPGNYYRSIPIRYRRFAHLARATTVDRGHSLATRAESVGWVTFSVDKLGQLH